MVLAASLAFLAFLAFFAFLAFYAFYAFFAFLAFFASFARVDRRRSTALVTDREPRQLLRRKFRWAYHHVSRDRRLSKLVNPPPS